MIVCPACRHELPYPMKYCGFCGYCVAPISEEEHLQLAATMEPIDEGDAPVLLTQVKQPPSDKRRPKESSSQKPRPASNPVRPAAKPRLEIVSDPAESHTVRSSAEIGPVELTTGEFETQRFDRTLQELVDIPGENSEEISSPRHGRRPSTRVSSSSPRAKGSDASGRHKRSSAAAPQVGKAPSKSRADSGKRRASRSVSSAEPPVREARSGRRSSVSAPPIKLTKRRLDRRATRDTEPDVVNTAPTPPERECKRFPVKVEVSYGSEHNFYTGFSENLSSGGLFVATHTPLALNDVVELSFSVPGLRRTCRARARVQWIREFNVAAPDMVPGMGLRFVKLDAEARAAVELFIKHRDPIFFED